MEARVRKDHVAEFARVFGDELTDKAQANLEPPYRPTGSIHDYRHEPIVYYMRMDRLVKIGTTWNILMRTNTIMPMGVLAVEWGSQPLERRRHGQFWNDHSHGEWYWLREPLWAHIIELRNSAVARLGVSTEEWLKAHGPVGDGDQT